MADIATMKLELDASGALRSVEELGRKLLGLQPKARSTGDAVVAFGANTGTTAKQTEKLGDAIGKTGERARDASGRFVGAGEAANEAQKSFQNLEKTSKRLGVAFGGAVVAGIVLTVKNTIEAEQAFAQLEARVKSTGGAAGFSADQLAQMASELQQVSTYGDEAVQEMQSVLLTFTQVRGDNFTRASAAILDMATALGTDLQGAAIQVGKALQDPTKGVAALGRAGVQFSADQQAMIESLQATGDLAGAQTVILKELETQFGGAALAARNTLGGALVSLKNAFGDLLEVPGLVSPITEALNTLVSYISDPATIGGVRVFIKTSILLFTAFGSAVADVVGIIATSLGQLAGFFGKLSGSDSPLNRFSRGMDSVATFAAKASIGLDGLGIRVAEAEATMRSAQTTTAKFGSALSVSAEQTEEQRKKADALKKSLEDLQKQMQTPGGLGMVDIASERPLMAGPEATTQVVIEPAEASQSKFEEFFGWLATEGGVQFDKLGGSLGNVFTNIVERGKASFGDLFSLIGGMATPGGALSAAAGIGSVVAEIFGGGASRAKAERDRLKSEIDSFNDSLESFVDSFTDTGSEFNAALKRIADYFKVTSAEIDGMLTKTARNALNKAGGNVDAAIADLTRRNDPSRNVNLGPAIAQLEAFKKATAELSVAQKEATEAAIKELDRRRKEFTDDLDVRRLDAMGQSEAADALRLRLKNEKELQYALNEFGPITAGIVEEVQKLEAAAIAAQELKEAERVKRELGFTIGGLDAQIAREMGNTEQAEAIERDIERQRILAEVTDATVKAKYEELWALQDANRALEELKKAAELVAEQQMRSEDLEVRKLMATGKTIEAEELRFQLEQARELRRAEGELARGEITQEIFDQLREVLGLEEIAFSNRNQGATDPAGAGAASASRGGTGQISNLATAQVQDIDRVVGELTTIRVRAGQLVQLMTALVRGGGILGAVNAGIQGQRDNNLRQNGNIVVS